VHDIEEEREVIFESQAWINELLIMSLSLFNPSGWYIRPAT
jgi:hypothetical protein